MPCYCLKHRKNTESKNPKNEKTKNGKMTLSWNCATCGHKKLGFIKEQEASGLVRMLGLKIPLSKIPLAGNILF